MSLVSKITGYVAPKAAEAVAKYAGKALYTVKEVGGVRIKTFVKTGTQVAENVDGNGAKTIALGAGNKLSEVLGKGTRILSYPKGSFFGGKDGLILCSGDPKKLGLSFTHKEFGEFVKMLKAMGKESA